MNKNATKTQVKNAKPGRPRYTPSFPRGKFTFDAFCVANGVDPDTGKGERCSAITLRKFLKRDAARRSNSLVALVKGETRKPTGESGLGAPRKLYTRRATAPITKPTMKKTAVTSPVSVPLSTPASAPLVTDLGLGAPAAEAAPVDQAVGQ